MADVEKKTVQIDLELDTSIVDSSKNKYQGWIDLAKAVDAWRIFPRLFLTVYIFLLYYWLIWIEHNDLSPFYQRLIELHSLKIL